MHAFVIMGMVMRATLLFFISVFLGGLYLLQCSFT